jgi:hypothetical protein
VIATVALSPVAVPQVPPTLVTDVLRDCGKVAAAPFTVVRVTVGAVMSMVIVFVPLVPELPAVSPWLATAV